MPDEIERKDILNKIDTLTLKVGEGFARNDALYGGIIQRLDTLNGKVADHERFKQDQMVKDAVQVERITVLKQQEENHITDNKKFDTMIKGNFWGVVFNLLAMGLVALITFYLTRK